MPLAISHKPFRIGVVSDTHSLPLPEQMLDDLKETDLIIHAGDFCGISDWERFALYKKLEAVYGNMDEAKLQKALPRKRIITCEKVKIGLFHGEGPPETILRAVAKEFKRNSVQVIVFGHSHQPFNKTIQEVLYFNPGSPTDQVFAPYRSYGLLTIENRKVQGKIVKIKD